MWGFPGPGLEPVSPALAGGFLTTVLPGQSLDFSLILSFPFRSVIHFELIILKYVESISRFFFLVCGCLVVPAL